MPFLFQALADAGDNRARLAEALRTFVDSVRPANDAACSQGLDSLLVRIRAHDGDRAVLTAAVASLVGGSKHVSLYADAGILPPTGFVSEMYRRISHRLLPDVSDSAYLRDTVEQALHHRRDDTWLTKVPPAQWRELITLLTPANATARAALALHIDTELRNAVNVLSLRLAGLGLDSELLRVYPQIEDFDSPFLTQNKEIQRWLALTAARIEHGAPTSDDARDADAMHAIVLLDQCRAILDRARKKTATIGTSFRLTYLMRRLEQTITRIESILAVFNSTAEAREDACAALLADVVCAKSRRNDIREHITQSMDLVALRVTQNAGRTGDHYITETRAEYFSMFRAALGAGFVVAFMAWAKVGIIDMRLPPLIEVFSICAMYASAFIVMHILHFSLATKQPAMTAAAIAASLEESRDEKTSSRMERLTDTVARVTRSQLAAIIGNVALALPTALALTWLVSMVTGAHIVEPAKAAKLVHEASLLTLAPMYAGIAGVVLFIGGLISGFFDNKASYSRIGDRLRAHRLLQRVLGRDVSNRFATYIENNLGALAGNAALGVMLGLVGPLGTALGLPLDVRHVTIATASLGLALPVAFMDISIGTAFAIVFGIAAIGFFNLVVSFSLTLVLAFKARRVSVPERHRFLPTLWARLRERPREFFLPPRE